MSQHLSELRARVALGILALVGLWMVGWMMHPAMLDWLVAPWCRHLGPVTARTASGEAAACTVASFRLTGGVSARLMVAAIPAVLGGVPIVVWQGWCFCFGPTARPGSNKALAPRRRPNPWAWVGWGLIGLWGASIGVTLLLARPILSVLVAIGQPWVAPIITLEGILSALVGLFIVVLVLFVVPLGVGAALFTGLITPTDLVRFRPFVVMGALVLAGVLTPTTDPITMVIVALWPIGMVEAMGLVGKGVAAWQAHRAAR